jgi:hypothetical protein
MQLRISHTLLMIVLVRPVLSAEHDRPTNCVTGQSPNGLSLAEGSSIDLPIVLAGAAADGCLAKCSSELQSCVDRCPGFDESNVVDPKYATRKCKAACNAALSDCKSECPKD